jgi:hypothetical protein
MSDWDAIEAACEAMHDYAYEDTSPEELDVRLARITSTMNEGPTKRILSAARSTT